MSTIPVALAIPAKSGFAFSTDRHLRIVRASGWYDLLVTWPFVLPWTFVWLYAQLVTAAVALGLPGTLHALDATHMLLANLLGSVVVVVWCGVVWCGVVWSIARIAAPTLLLGRLDGVARVLFSAWQIYAVAHGASAVVLGFTLFEVGCGVLQWWRVAG